MLAVPQDCMSGATGWAAPSESVMKIALNLFLFATSMWWALTRELRTWGILVSRRRPIKRTLTFIHERTFPVASTSSPPLFIADPKQQQPRQDRSRRPHFPVEHKIERSFPKCFIGYLYLNARKQTIKPERVRRPMWIPTL